MALVAQLYNLSINEAMKLTDEETQFLLDAADKTIYHLAATDRVFQDSLNKALSPIIQQIRSARITGREGGEGIVPIGPPPRGTGRGPAEGGSEEEPWWKR